MRNFAVPALALAVSLAGCGGGSTVPGGLVLNWAAGGTTGNQYTTLHLAAGASASISVTESSLAQNFVAFLSGGMPNGISQGNGPPTPSSACPAFALDANAANEAISHSVTAVTAGTCYLVVQSPSLAYTQLQVTSP